MHVNVKVVLSKIIIIMNITALIYVSVNFCSLNYLLGAVC
jgi:hypothetical protein